MGVSKNQGLDFGVLIWYCPWSILRALIVGNSQVPTPVISLGILFCFDYDITIRNQ